MFASSPSSLQHRQGAPCAADGHRAKFIQSGGRGVLSEGGGRKDELYGRLLLRTSSRGLREKNDNTGTKNKSRWPLLPLRRERPALSWRLIDSGSRGLACWDIRSPNSEISSLYTPRSALTTIHPTLGFGLEGCIMVHTPQWKYHVKQICCKCMSLSPQGGTEGISSQEQHAEPLQECMRVGSLYSPNPLPGMHFTPRVWRVRTSPVLSNQLNKSTKCRCGDGGLGFEHMCEKQSTPQTSL